MYIILKCISTQLNLDLRCGWTNTSSTTTTELGKTSATLATLNRANSFGRTFSASPSSGMSAQSHHKITPITLQSLVSSHVWSQDHITIIITSVITNIIKSVKCVITNIMITWSDENDQVSRHNLPGALHSWRGCGPGKIQPSNKNIYPSNYLWIIIRQTMYG